MAIDSTTRATASSLLNYDVPDSGSDSETDIFARLDKTLSSGPQPKASKTKITTTTLNPKPTTSTSTSTSTSSKRPLPTDSLELGLGLGIDDPLSLPRKKRRPTPKLDSTLLLSSAGLPRLLALADSGPDTLAKRIGLRRAAGPQGRGKGAGDFGDAERLLAFYQLWLDGLFPRARFRDALGLVDKAGRGREVAVWRSRMGRRVGGGGRGGEGRDEDEDRGIEKDKENAGGNVTGKENGEGDTGMFFPDAGVGARGEGLGRLDEEEELEEDLEALLAQQEARIDEMERDMGLGDNPIGNDDRNEVGEGDMNDNDEDELDAILAEQEGRM